MADTHRMPKYLSIFWALLILTVLEVGVVYLPLGKSLQVAALLILAVVKAALVALFFMHLKFDRRLLALVAIAPLVLLTLVALLVIVGPALAGR